MNIGGFSFSKISIEKKDKFPKDFGNFEVNSNLNIKEVSKEDIKIMEGKESLRLNFEYTLNYSKDIAKLSFAGSLLLLLEPKKAEDVLKNWKKGEKFDKEIQLNVFNVIFQRCSIKAFS